MSYILDALRKAERERGIRQVPTLMTDHSPRTMSRNRLWMVLGTLGVFVALIAGYLVFLQKPESTPPAVNIAGGPGTNAIGGGDRGSVVSKSSIAPPPLNTQESTLPSQKSSIAGIPSGTPAATMPRGASGGTPGSNLRRMVPPDVEEDISLPDEEEEIILPPQDTMGASRRMRVAPAEPKAAEVKSESLQEAVAGMTLSLLMFADTKEERMVFINGTRYEEGDLVEGLYLLESITIDGAILSYQGERALLQPKSK